MTEHDAMMNVNKLCKINSEIDRLTKEKEKLEGIFLNDAQIVFDNKKTKSVHYYGEGHNEICVTLADKVEINKPNIIKKLLGDNSDMLLTRRTVWSLRKSDVKKTLAGIFKNEFWNISKKSILCEYISDLDVIKTCMQKVRGVDFEKDVKALMFFADMDRANAELVAYMINESVCYEKFIGLISSGEFADKPEKAFEVINRAVTVTTSPKIKATYGVGE